MLAYLMILVNFDTKSARKTREENFLIFIKYIYLNIGDILETFLFKWGTI